MLKRKPLRMYQRGAVILVFSAKLGTPKIVFKMSSRGLVLAISWPSRKSTTAPGRVFPTATPPLHLSTLCSSGNPSCDEEIRSSVPNGVQSALRTNHSLFRPVGPDSGTGGGTREDARHGRACHRGGATTPGADSDEGGDADAGHPSSERVALKAIRSHSFSMPRSSAGNERVLRSD
jgi:hypothetical protein